MNLKIFVLATMIVFHVTNVSGQSLVSKSNEISVSMKGTGMPDTGALPHVEWIAPKLEFTSTAENKIEIKATVHAPGSLKEISLVVGNSATGEVSATKKFIVTPDQKKYDIISPVILSNGANFVSITAITAGGISVSEKRSITAGKNAGDILVSADRKDYALLFATDKYDNWDDLVNPVDDAHAIARELTEKYGFTVELVENPTVETIWEKLREYNERKFAPQDQLMVFFAGHGHYDESFGEGFVVAKNSLTNDRSRTTYLSHNRLRGVINNIPCNHILLTMDVCFGGTLDPVIARSRGAKDVEVSVNEMLVRKWSHRTRKYLTSGAKEYVSDGIAGNHSPFAGKFIESLRSMGGADRILTLTELQADLEKLKQLPRFGSFGEDESLSDFVFIGK